MMDSKQPSLRWTVAWRELAKSGMLLDGRAHSWTPHPPTARKPIKRRAPREFFITSRAGRLA